MKNFKNTGLIVFIILVGSCVVFFLSKEQRDDWAEFSDYSRLLISDSLSDSFFVKARIKGYLYLLSSDSSQKIVIGYSKELRGDLTIDKYFVNEFYLFKKRGSDTLYVDNMKGSQLQFLLIN
jgi:hypothetical protein